MSFKTKLFLLLCLIMIQGFSGCPPTVPCTSPLGCSVTVESITLTSTGFDLEIGDTKAIVASVVYKDGKTDKDLNYKSSDSSIVTVNAQGQITAMKDGSATISVNANKDNKIEKTVNITVKVPVKVNSVKINNQEISLRVAGTQALSAVVSYSNNITDNQVIWTVSDQNIGVVEGGVLKALKAGSLTVTATPLKDSTKTDSVTIKIEPKCIEGICEPTKVTIKSGNLTLKTGDTSSLTAEVEYSDNSKDNNVTWLSSVPDTVSIDQNGGINALKAGKATLTASSKIKPEIKSSIEVNVSAPLPVLVSLSPASLSIKVGGTDSFTATVTYANNKTDNNVTWSSDNTAAVTVNNGTVTGIAEGIANITATASDGTIKKSATVSVSKIVVASPYPSTAPLTVSSVTISPKPVADIEVGNNTTKLTASVSYSSGSPDEDVTWISSDPTIASIDSTGKISALKVGESVTITATSVKTPPKTDTVKVTVKAKPIVPTSVVVTPDTLTLFKGANSSLNVTVKMSDGTTNNNVTWSSDKTDIATVFGGTVKGESPGTAIITATASDGTTKDTATVTVKLLTVALVVINTPSTTTPKVGDTVNLSARVTMSDNTHPNTEVTWISSDPTIATIDSTSGLLQAQAKGNVIITASSTKDNTKKDTLAISVQIPGKLIYTDGSSIYSSNADGSNSTTLTSGAYESVSYDGTKITFTRSGINGIFLMNIDGSGITQISSGTGDFGPDFSRNGSKIYFASSRAGDGQADIYSMNIDGSGSVRYPITTYPDSLPGTADDYNPSVNFSGMMVFASDRQIRNLWMMNITDKSMTRLTNTGNNNGRDEIPMWSPDGSKIVFQSSRDGNYEIYTINGDGSEPKRITNNSASDMYPNWTKDGKIIFSSNRDGGTYQVFMLEADGSGITKLTTSSGDKLRSFLIK